MATAQPHDSWQWSRRDVRVLIDRFSAVASDAAALTHASQRLRPEAGKLVAELIDRQVDSQLRRLAVEELRPHLEPRTKLSPLESRGFHTVSSILDVDARRLATVNGISAHTAGQVHQAAVRVRDGIAADTNLRFDPSQPDAQQTALLAHLTAIRHAETTTRELGSGPHQLINSATVLIPRAKPAATTLRKLLARKKTKDAAFAAAEEIQRQLTDNARLIDRVSQAVPLTEPGHHAPESVWKAFAADAAAFYALLSDIEPAAADDQHDATRGHIGDQLGQQVANVDLDTGHMKATLRGYQRFGAQFVLRQGKAILGDEMGLGKTVQALAACAHLAAGGQRRFVVICPASVLLNWLAEIEKHTTLSAHKLHGPQREAAGDDWLRHGGVAVTTFDTIARLRCLEDVRDFAMVIVDEAHYIKNQATNRAKAIRPFLDRGQYALFLSGTPLENRVAEFRTLMGYLRPDIAARISPETGLAGAKAFRREVAAGYLRRNQTDVLRELPEKIEVDEWVQLTSADLKIYRRVLDEPATIGLLEKLRHAAYQADASAKLTRTVELVREAREDGLKTVVFSRYLGVLARVQGELDGIMCRTLTGGIAADKRQTLIAEFTGHNGPAVLLAQIETGGTGINLQSASAVIITEPQWKPSIEEQAIARLHRMGQIRNVRVHRILAKETIDELLLLTQERKRVLFDEFARESHAKDTDRRAVDTLVPPVLSQDESIPLELRMVRAERDRVGR